MCFFYLNYLAVLITGFSNCVDLHPRPHEKADSTRRCSQAVPHPSTNQALRRLTSEVGRDPVYSTRYGRQREMCPEMRRTFVRRRCLEKSPKCSLSPHGTIIFIHCMQCAKGSHGIRHMESDHWIKCSFHDFIEIIQLSESLIFRQS